MFPVLSQLSAFFQVCLVLVCSAWFPRKEGGRRKGGKEEGRKGGGRELEANQRRTVHTYGLRIWFETGDLSTAEYLYDLR